MLDMIIRSTFHPLWRLSKLFDDLQVETVQSDMSLSIAGRGVATEDFEWSSQRPFSSWADALKLRNWRRLLEILSFERRARQALSDGSLGDQTRLGDRERSGAAEVEGLARGAGLQPTADGGVHRAGGRGDLELFHGGGRPV